MSEGGLPRDGPCCPRIGPISAIDGGELAACKREGDTAPRTLGGDMSGGAFGVDDADAVASVNPFADATGAGWW